MASTKPTVLIIGGGWHTPQSYSKLRTTLESAGFQVHVPPLPSTNESRPPNADLNTDTAHIRSYTQDLVKDGREVIVLMHSYGGQVGTNALHGLAVNDRAREGRTGGVTNLIYLAACVLPEGKGMVDMVRHFGHEELMPLAFDLADDMSCVSRDPKTLFIGADSGLPDAEVDEYLSTLVRWNGQCMFQPLTTSRAAWRDVPVTYIHATKDMSIPFDYQKWLVDGMRKEGVVVQTALLETGHCPNLTAADEVTSIVGMVAKGQKVEMGSADETSTTGSDVRDAISGVGNGKA